MVEGLCTTCRRQPPAPRRKTCARRLEEGRGRKRDLCAERRNAGKCGYCGKQAAAALLTLRMVGVYGRAAP